jgi:hypothetical protein
MLTHEGSRYDERIVLLLAISAQARPGHRIQARGRYRLIALLADAECIPINPAQGGVDRPQKAGVVLPQPGLNLNFLGLRRPIEVIAQVVAGIASSAFAR